MVMPHVDAASLTVLRHAYCWTELQAPTCSVPACLCAVAACTALALLSSGMRTMQKILQTISLVSCRQGVVCLDCGAHCRWDERAQRWSQCWHTRQLAVQLCSWVQFTFVLLD